ncbi:MAG: hypothetical protein LCI00_18075 [Chloroflexi bacterium]|nr:hypothetical protein [Chloroflexota bacterium]
MRFVILMSFMLLALGAKLSAHDATPIPVAKPKYTVKVSTDGATVEATKPFTLTFQIDDANTGTPITAFDEVHTKLLHLIIVSEDLSVFIHLHPVYQGNGVFQLNDVMLPNAANYVVFTDFTPTGDTQQVVRSELAVSGAQSTHAHLNSSSPEVSVGDLKITLDATAQFTVGSETTLNFHVTNAATGVDVTNLEEYLGAAGHLVILDPAAQTYIHTHPAGHDMAAMSGMDHAVTATPLTSGMDTNMNYGPHLQFEAVFPMEGLWVMWLQVQYQGEIYTFPYVVEVSGEAGAAPSAHSHG